MDEPLHVRLDDTDSSPIGERSLGALPPKDAPFRKWQFKSRAAGPQKVLLKDLGGGQFKLTVKAKRWFTAVQANQVAADTRLTVIIGGECRGMALTRKSD